MTNDIQLLVEDDSEMRGSEREINKNEMRLNTSFSVPIYFMLRRGLLG